MRKFKIKLYKAPNHLSSYWIHQPFIVLLIVIFGLSFNILMPYGAVMLGRVIDTILISSSYTPVINSLITYIEIIIFIQSLRFVKRFYIRRFANTTLVSMRTHIFNTILSQPYSSFLNTDTGNLLSRIVGDVDACVEGMRKGTTEIFDTGVLMIAYLIAMFSFDVKITLYSIIFIPISIILAEKLKGFIVKASIAYRKQNAKVTSLTLEASENALLYRISSVDPIIQSNYDKALEDLRKKAVRANILENSMQALYNAIAMAGVAFIFILGGEKVMSGSWTIGTFTAYLTIFTAMALKSSKAAKLLNSVQKSSVSWQRIKNYMKPYQDYELSQASDTSIDLKVENVSFGYNEDLILNAISFNLKSGQILGISGPIASGKSTLLTVLTGLLDYQGSIKINNQELREMSEKERSTLIAYLPQRVQLFGSSLGDNITWDSQGDIGLVLKQTQLDEEVNAMEHQQDTSAGNLGNRLSGGQKARIALARTLYSKRRILLLDDPFASVDIATQQKILDALRQSFSDCIILMVSHRINSFASFDSVLFLEEGKAIVGSHTELLNQCKLYHDIVDLQNKEIDDEK